MRSRLSGAESTKQNGCEREASLVKYFLIASTWESGLKGLKIWVRMWLMSVTGLSIQAAKEEGRSEARN